MLKHEREYLAAAARIADARGLFQPNDLRHIPESTTTLNRLEDRGYITHRTNIGFLLTAAAFDFLQMQDELDEQRAEAAAQRRKDRKVDAVIQGCISVVSAIVGALISLASVWLAP